MTNQRSRQITAIIAAHHLLKNCHDFRKSFDPQRTEHKQHAENLFQIERADNYLQLTFASRDVSKEAIYNPGVGVTTINFNYCKIKLSELLP